MTSRPRRAPDAQEAGFGRAAGAGLDRLGLQYILAKPVAAENAAGNLENDVATTAMWSNVCASERRVQIVPRLWNFRRVPDIATPNFGGHVATILVAVTGMCSREFMVGTIWIDQRAIGLKGQSGRGDHEHEEGKSKHGEVSLAMLPHSLMFDNRVALGTASKTFEGLFGRFAIRLVQHPDSRSDALGSVLDEDGGVVSARGVGITAIDEGGDGRAALQWWVAEIMDGRAFLPEFGRSHFRCEMLDQGDAFAAFAHLFAAGDDLRHPGVEVLDHISVLGGGLGPAAVIIAGLGGVLGVGHGESPMKKAARWGRSGARRRCGVDASSLAANDNVVNLFLPVRRAA